MKNNNIIKVRKKLDLLDNKFLNLIKKIDKNLTEKIWKTIIKETINYEFKNFKKKK